MIIIKCWECGNKIEIKRTFKTLFLPIVHFACCKCYSRVKYFGEEIVLPIDNHLLFWYPLITETPKHNNSYDSYLANNLLKILKVKSNKIVLVLDNLDEKMFEILTQFNFSDLYLLTITINKD